MTIQNTVISSIFSLIVVILGFSSAYSIDQSERGVITRAGKVTGTAEPGLGFKVPLLDGISKISVQTHTAIYDNVSAYSKDQQTATLRLSVTYHINPGMVETLYGEFQSREAAVARTLDRSVPTQAENVFGKYNAITAVQERTRLGRDITEALKGSITGVLVIDTVQLENIDFSPAYEKSVEDRMKAEVEVQTQLQNLEKERVNAQIAITKAQAEADSHLARAVAEAESIRIKGIAEATAIKSRADALAQNENLVELTKAERWNGVLPTTVLPNGTLPFIDAIQK
jgi:regulator of protease activity HflC (stomatin/prohibitin superfamily)